MPDVTIVVTATGTEVGKTWTLARLLERLHGAGVEVHARKPVQSFDPGDETTDAAILARASGEEVSKVCPQQFNFPVPMAPPMAAAALGRAPFGLAEVIASIDMPKSGVMFVEGVGGARSPLAMDGDTVDLVRVLHTDATILVAVPELGVINDVLLSVAALEPPNPVIFLNRFDENQEMHVRNLRWLQDIERLTVATSIDALANALPIVTAAPVGGDL